MWNWNIPSGPKAPTQHPPLEEFSITTIVTHTYCLDQKPQGIIEVADALAETQIGISEKSLKK